MDYHAGVSVFSFHVEEIRLERAQLLLLSVQKNAPIRFHDQKVTTVNPKPQAFQVGAFKLDTAGNLVFTTEFPPIVQADGVATEQNHSITISSAQLRANDSDPDSDPLTIVSVSATSTNGGSVVLSGGSITYTPVAGFTGLDQFTYTVSDGRGGTTSGQVTLFVSDGPLPAQNALTITPKVNGFLIRFAGTPGHTYDIQRAPEVTGSRGTITTIVAPLYGIIEYLDQNSPAGMAFYRALAH